MLATLRTPDEQRRDIVNEIDDTHVLARAKLYADRLHEYDFSLDYNLHTGFWSISDGDFVTSYQTLSDIAADDLFYGIVEEVMQCDGCGDFEEDGITVTHNPNNGFDYCDDCTPA